ERKAFDTEPVEPQTAHLRVQQALFQVLCLGEISKKLGKTILRKAEELFVLPKSVIGIEADRREPHGLSLPEAHSVTHSGGFPQSPRPRGSHVRQAPQGREVLVEGVQCVEVVLIESKVENSDIFFQMPALIGFRDGDGATLQV